MICAIVGCSAREPDLTWQRIQAQGTIRVGMDPNWVPFEYVDEAGALAGFDVDLARTLGDRLGLEVQLVANLSFDGLYDALTVGQADVIISAVVVDAAQSADFCFSHPYFDAGQVLVVGPEGADIDGITDLQGRTVAVELGSEGDMVARRWARRLAGLSLLHTDTSDGALDAVAAGRADAALTDRATALLALKARDHDRRTTAARDEARAGGATELVIRGEPVTGEQYAAVVREESGDLLRAIDAALTEMARDGTLQALERKWLGP